MKVKWITLENSDGTASLKQHGFIAAELGRRRYTDVPYIGNVSLCGRVRADNGNEEEAVFSSLIGEIQHPEACKKCLAKYNKSIHLV